MPQAPHADPSRAILDDVLQRCRDTRAAGKVPVVVFDLDHTLFDNGPRTWALLAEFLETNGHTELRQRLESVSRFNLPYLLRDLLRGALGVSDPALEKAAFDYWFARFFTDRWIDRDVPYEGCMPYVRAVFETGATVVYLTGRDSPNMLLGTTASLHRFGFPVGVAHTVLVLKPAFEIPDPVFKRDAVGFVGTLGEVVGFFDNEPANCNVAAESWPTCRAVFIDTVRAPGPLELHPSVVTITGYPGW